MFFGFINKKADNLLLFGGLHNLSPKLRRIECKIDGRYGFLVAIAVG
jgi:hypothetical protein